MQSSIPLIEIYANGTSWELVPGGSDALSYFGGPNVGYLGSEVDLPGAVIHHVATINVAKFGPGNIALGFSVPLLYGICHEGCELTYRKTAPAAVQITSLEPQAAEDGYPYHGYPAVLPYYPLGVAGSESYEVRDLEDRIANTGWKTREGCLYAVVMQHPSIGHCLFTPNADAEIVFEYDLQKGTVRATNQCS